MSTPHFVAIEGPIGVGKTTLIRMLVEAVGTESDALRFNPQTVLGYYDQELEEASSTDDMALISGVMTRRS